MITNEHIEQFIAQAHRVGDAGLTICSSGNISWRIGDEVLLSGTVLPLPVPLSLHLPPDHPLRTAAGSAGLLDICRRAPASLSAAWNPATARIAQRKYFHVGADRSYRLPVLRCQHRASQNLSGWAQISDYMYQMIISEPTVSCD